jgi:hypothetical protein
MIGQLKDKFKEHKDLIFGYSSFIGLFISAGAFAYSFSLTEENRFNIAIITFSVVILCLTIGSVYITRRYDKLHQKYSESVLEIKKLKADRQSEINGKRILYPWPSIAIWCICGRPAWYGFSK